MAPIPARRRHGNGNGGLRPNPLWYREAVIYEIPVRAFSDSNGDGIGDLPGLITKLDYLADLGVTALWLLPFYPSPMRDGGYDISDYTGVDPMFGTLDDFKRLLAEAHERGIRVITELVINHTSKDHPWFERARRSPADSPWRDYYVWSDTADRYRDARVIFKDFETSNWSWDPVARAYYWHRFYSHQPDLNFDNPEVHEALFRVCDFWLDMGVDGLRLDAVPYLYEREGTNCENLDETHAFLRRLRAHVDAKYKDRMLLAEANQWPVDAAAYFGNGDECHMNFHFPLMPRLFMSLQLEDRFPIIDILRQTPPIPETCQWATFLRNHDELTLEMVTDQDRDYMYRAYADDPSARLNLGIRRRLAPLLKTRQRIELVYGLLLSLPGTPVLYYGDEIGMGDNIYLPDRDGVRTPMQWSADRNAGFSRANPQKLYLPIITDPEYHYEAVNVEHQEGSQHSLLWWTKRLIAVAKKSKVLGTGGIEFLMPENHKILAYMRTREADQVLVVANLSRFPQYVELDLAAYEGKVPFEIFSNVPFPIIGKQPYLLTLSPHTFFWFKLRPMDGSMGVTKRGPDKLLVHESWRELVAPEAESDVALALLDYAIAKRWFRGKARTIKDARVIDRIALGPEDADPVLMLLQVDYMEGDPEVYSIPVVAMRGEEAERREQRNPGAIVARVEGMEPTSPGLGTFQPAIAVRRLRDRRRRLAADAHHDADRIPRGRGGSPDRATRRHHRGADQRRPATGRARAGVGADQQRAVRRRQGGREGVPASRSRDQPRAGGRRVPVEGRGSAPGPARAGRGPVRGHRQAAGADRPGARDDRQRGRGMEPDPGRDWVVLRARSCRSARSRPRTRRRCVSPTRPRPRCRKRCTSWWDATSPWRGRWASAWATSTWHWVVPTPSRRSRRSRSRRNTSSRSFSGATRAWPTRSTSCADGSAR